MKTSKFVQLNDFHKTWYGHMTLDDTLAPYLLISHSHNNNVDVQICEAGAPLAPLLDAEVMYVD